jgi:branched-chain amino acid transport system permease protein
MDTIVALYAAQALNGLAYGMLLFLVSSGLTLIYGMMGFFNLAHAFFFMLASYFCSTFLDMTGSYWMSLILAPFAVAVIGMSAERLFLRNLEFGPLGYIGQILPTLGIALMLASAVAIFWQGKQLWVEVPELLEGLVSIAGLEYPLYRLFIIGLSLVILAIMGWILFKTRLGLITRAAVSDAGMVNALGVNIPLVFTIVFGIATWLAGVAGVVLTPLFLVTTGFAYMWALESLVVVVVGGLGSLPGAFVVALLLGQLHAFGVQLTPKLGPILMFLFMVLVLSFKPAGLFGERK